MKKNDLFFTPAMQEHMAYFTKNTHFLAFSTRKRTKFDYEKDLIRLYVLQKKGGRLGEAGSTAHLFSNCGVIQIEKNSIKEDEIFEIVKKDKKISKYINNKVIIKKIYVPRKVLNIVI